ncbi:hypothetical protein EJB05_40233, partial [Eragrostis curvula]
MQDLLRTILSRLTQKEAVRMSILSKKWKRLWKCYPEVVFTRATVRNTDATIGHQTTRRIRFIRGVNSVLRQFRSSILQKFVIKFGLRKRHTRHIDRWIRFSAASKTKHIVLDFSPGRKGSTDTVSDGLYSFPLDIFNASGGSYIMPIVLGEPIKISEATINFISSSDCFDYVFSELVKTFSHVQSLSINFKIQTEVQGFVKNPSMLTCLRHLVLKIDIGGFSEDVAGIHHLAYFLELAPVLEELVLHMYCFQPACPFIEPREGVLPPCPHKHLKTVLVTGFYGFRGQFELVLHILRNATCLERMTIDPVVRNNTFLPSPKLAETDVKRGRRLAMENLWRKGFGKVLRIL